jgi:hypothetical protein
MVIRSPDSVTMGAFAVSGCPNCLLRTGFDMVAPF